MREELAGELVRLCDGPEVAALVLMGSFARAEAGPYSDVDLVRFVREASHTESQTLFLGDQLVVIGTVTPERVERWFTEPGDAVDSILGLRTAKVLLERDGYFSEIQSRANSFVWDTRLQANADVWASGELVGLIEEVHKGLNGLALGDRGRLLNARFGLSWLLSGVIKVQRGVLLHGDNGIYADLIDALGVESEWVRLRRIAWGIEDEAGVAPTLPEQVVAGLQLYVETVRLLEDAIQPADAPRIYATVERIRQKLMNGLGVSSAGE